MAMRRLFLFLGWFLFTPSNACRSSLGQPRDRLKGQKQVTFSLASRFLGVSTDFTRPKHYIDLLRHIYERAKVRIQVQKKNTCHPVPKTGKEGGGGG